MNTTSQKPTIGRIVHYWVLNSEECQGTPSPAIVTNVHRGDDSVDLQVFGTLPSSESPFRFRVTESSDGAAGTWCWPPRG